MTLKLPRDLAKGDVTLTATTPAEYHDLIWRGFTVVDGPAVASVSYDELTPAQKAARTRAENKAREEAGGEDPVDTSSEAVDVNLENQAGDANPS